MAFKINDEDWQPQTTAEHTESILQKINALLQKNNVTDKKGNIVQLKASYGNALYLISLGDGEKFAELDAKLSAAINSFNIELCDDQQLQNLLPIAAMTRNPGSYSTLQLAATAIAEGPCTIPAGTKAPFENVNFVTTTDVDIEPGETKLIDTVCDTLGPVVVLAGEITSFDTEVLNLAEVTNPTSSAPGVAPETTNELRQRLLKGDTIRYSLDGCKNALEALTGVTYARVYFNYNTDTPIELEGGVVIQPRKAYVVIYGDSPKIAETYAEYQSAETQNAEDAGTRAHSQTFVTESGQEMEIKYDEATTQTIHVKIVLEEETERTNQVVNKIKRDLIRSSAAWTIGQHVTSLLASRPFTNITYAKVAYAEVSTDGETWENHIVTGCNVIPVVSDGTITVTSLNQEPETIEEG